MKRTEKQLYNLGLAVAGMRSDLHDARRRIEAIQNQADENGSRVSALVIDSVGIRQSIDEIRKAKPPKDARVVINVSGGTVTFNGTAGSGQ